MNRAEAGAGPLLSLISRQNQHECTLTDRRMVNLGGLPTARIVSPILRNSLAKFEIERC